VSWLNDLPEPTDAELRAIEAEAELLAADLAAIDAESAWLRDPSPGTAARYISALLELIDLVDLVDLGDHYQAVA